MKIAKNVISGQRKINQMDLTGMVAQEAGVSPAEAAAVMRALFDVVGREVVSGSRISVTNFGTWSSRKVVAGNRRNPSTGEVFPVRESRRPWFIWSPAVREAVRGGTVPETFRKRSSH